MSEDEERRIIELRQKHGRGVARGRFGLNRVQAAAAAGVDRSDPPVRPYATMGRTTERGTTETGSLGGES
jgi:hypothetical protein